MLLSQQIQPADVAKRNGVNGWPAQAAERARRAQRWGLGGNINDEAAADGVDGREEGDWVRVRRTSEFEEEGSEVGVLGVVKERGEFEADNGGFRIGGENARGNDGEILAEGGGVIRGRRFVRDVGAGKVDLDSDVAVRANAAVANGELTGTDTIDAFSHFRRGASDRDNDGFVELLLAQELFDPFKVLVQSMGRVAEAVDGTTAVGSPFVDVVIVGEAVNERGARGDGAGFGGREYGTQIGQSRCGRACCATAAKLVFQQVIIIFSFVRICG